MENPGPGCHDASQDGGGYDSAGTEYVDEIPQICAGQSTASRSRIPGATASAARGAKARTSSSSTTGTASRRGGDFARRSQPASRRRWRRRRRCRRSSRRRRRAHPRRSRPRARRSHRRPATRPGARAAASLRYVGRCVEIRAPGRPRHRRDVSTQVGRAALRPGLLGELPDGRGCGYPAPADLVLLSPDELGTAILLHFSADVPVRPRVESTPSSRRGTSTTSRRWRGAPEI